MGIFAVHFPAFRCNKKCFQIMEAFFIFTAIRAKQDLSFAKQAVSTTISVKLDKLSHIIPNGILFDFTVTTYLHLTPTVS